MNRESSFVRKREPDEVLTALFEQRKKWFFHSLSSAIESVTSDKFVFQMFQIPSSKIYIPDRICEIITRSISDDKEMFIMQLLRFLSDNGNFFEIAELERIGSHLLNLSTKQIQIEMDQRNKIKQLTSPRKINNDQHKRIDTQKLSIILHKLTVLNTSILAIGQELRTFNRRVPMLFGNYQTQIKSYFSNYISKSEITINNFKSQNRKLTLENSRLSQVNDNNKNKLLKLSNEEITSLKDSLLKCQIKYKKLKKEKFQSDILSQKYQKQLKTAQSQLEIVKTENYAMQKEKISMQSELSKIQVQSNFNDSVQLQKSSELDSMKKQIQTYEEEIHQNRQKIDQLNQIIQSHEEMTSKKFQNLIISQKIIKRLKDEFEKVSFVLHEIKNIDSSKNNNEELFNQINFIKSKITSQNFESEILQELKEKCQQLMLTKNKIRQNFGEDIDNSNFKELSILIEICTNLTLQDELHEVLSQLNEKCEISKINSDSNSTITKLFRQLNRKTKENQRLLIINQKLQSQKDDIQQQLGDIKMQLRTNSSMSPLFQTNSRIVFSPNKSQSNTINANANTTPKTSTKSEIINQTFEDSASPILSMNRSYNYNINHKQVYNMNKTLSPQRFPLNNFSENDEGDDEGEKELIDQEIFNEKEKETKTNNFSIIKNILNQNSENGSYYNQNEDYTLIQTLSALFDMNNADEIPNKISNLMEKSEEYDHFQTTLCTALNINQDEKKNNKDESSINFKYTNEIMVQIQKLKFENKKMKCREEKIKMLFKSQVPSSQIPNEIAKVVKNLKYIQKILLKENFDSYQELFENYYSIKKLNKAFVEREEMFRNCFSKYEFEKMPQLLSALIKENKKFRSVEKELEKVESSITIFQAPRFISQIRENFVKLVEKFCKIIFNSLKHVLSESNMNDSAKLIGDLESNNDLINNIAKIEEMKILLPQDDVIDIRGFVKRIL